MICVGEIIVKLAAVAPPKRTSLAPVKFEPKIVTVSPIGAFVGAKEVITGAGTNVNPGKFAVPPGVVTDTAPEAPDAPTTAVICVGETIVKLVAGTPPKLTAVAPTRYAPCIVTVIPGPASAGEMLSMTGGNGMNVKPASVAEPPGVVTLTTPVAPVPTTTTTSVGLTGIKLATGTPPSVAPVVKSKPVPLMETFAPGVAVAGIKLVIVGGGAKPNPAKLPVPPKATT